MNIRSVAVEDAEGIAAIYAPIVLETAMPFVCGETSIVTKPHARKPTPRMASLKHVVATRRLVVIFVAAWLLDDGASASSQYLADLSDGRTYCLAANP